MMLLGWIQLRENYALASSSFHCLGPDDGGSHADRSGLDVVWACVAAGLALALGILVVDRVLLTLASFLLRVVLRGWRSDPPALSMVSWGCAQRYSALVGLLWPESHEDCSLGFSLHDFSFVHVSRPSVMYLTTADKNAGQLLAVGLDYWAKEPVASTGLIAMTERDLEQLHALERSYRTLDLAACKKHSYPQLCYRMGPSSLECLPVDQEAQQTSDR